jgi:Domain of unknown function (DUF4365)
MTVTGRTPGRRTSREQQGEDRSEGQLKDRFAALGWPCDRVGRDPGEDLNVRIHDDGASTGLTFLVQLKSTTDSAALKRKRSAALAYPLEVKDLLHWEVSVTLVVLVVWDVERQTGWWRPIPEIIKDLDATTKGWRKQKAAAVSVPLANGTDEAGLQQLQWAVARHSLPLNQGRNSFALFLSFALTEEGRRGAAALRNALDAGEPVELIGERLQRVAGPESPRRAHGDDFQPVSIQVAAETHDRSFPIRIEVESSEGRALYPCVELRRVKSGNNRLVMTNKQQKHPFLITLEMTQERMALDFKPRRATRDACEAREAAAFALAVNARDAIVRISNLDNRDPATALVSSERAPEETLEQLRRWYAFTDKLCFIQQRMRATDRLLIKNDPTSEEVASTNKLFNILRDGKLERTENFSFTVPPSERAVGVGDGPVHIYIEGEKETLFGVDIALGRIKQTVQDRAIFLEALLAAAAKTSSTGKGATVKLYRVRVVQEYLDWLPAKPMWDAVYEALDRLSAIVRDHDGYFTRLDTRAAGMSDTVFEVALREEKIEPVGSDVFHLVQFPRSDREELLSLWLRTDRRGVFSFDTALALNELSDILPRRRHITVPPGWDPDDRRVDADVVIHHAEIKPDEIRWIGPVPYTAPLRTLRDCIASHLSPDLIEQAIADGLRRGMFTKADLLPLTARRGAA